LPAQPLAVATGLAPSGSSSDETPLYVRNAHLLF
jgi:hypothetical protein